MERFAVLQPHLEADVPLARAARHAGVPVRTAERWLARYRQRGLAGLARPVRSDAAVRRLPADLVALRLLLGFRVFCSRGRLQHTTDG
jgi:putative transposase